MKRNRGLTKNQTVFSEQALDKLCKYHVTKGFVLGLLNGATLPWESDKEETVQIPHQGFTWVISLRLEKNGGQILRLKRSGQPPKTKKMPPLNPQNLVFSEEAGNQAGQIQISKKQLLALLNPHDLPMEQEEKTMDVVFQQHALRVRLQRENHRWVVISLESAKLHPKKKASEKITQATPKTVFSHAFVPFAPMDSAHVVFREAVLTTHMARMQVSKKKVIRFLQEPMECLEKEGNHYTFSLADDHYRAKMVRQGDQWIVTDIENGKHHPVLVYVKEKMKVQPLTPSPHGACRMKERHISLPDIVGMVKETDTIFQLQPDSVVVLEGNHPTGLPFHAVFNFSSFTLITTYFLDEEAWKYDSNGKFRKRNTKTA